MLIGKCIKWLVLIIFVSQQKDGAASDLMSEGLPQYVTSISLPDNAFLGGISGIDYDSGTMFAISDDRSEFDKARVYTFSLDNTFQPLNIRKYFLNDVNKKHFERGAIDPESLRLLDKDTFLWSSEISNNDAVLFISSLGTQQTTRVPLPDYMMPANEKNKAGSIKNKGIEGLSLSRNKNLLFIAFEAPLSSTNAQNPNNCLISVLDLQSNKIIYHFYYQVDPIVNFATAAPYLQDNGISEILLVNETTLLILERAGWHVGEGQFSFSNKIYQVSIPNMREFHAIDVTPQTITKSIYINVDELETGSQGNLEAMTLIERGDKEFLVLASDNNFNHRQKNELIVFRVK